MPEDGDVIRSFVKYILSDLEQIGFDPDILNQRIQDQLKSTFVGRGTSAQILLLIAADMYCGTWPDGISPYALGIALARAVANFSPQQEIPETFILSEIQRGFMEKVKCKFDEEQFLTAYGRLRTANN